MVKEILVFASILVASTLSGSGKASSLFFPLNHGTLESVSIDAESGALLLQGLAPSSCGRDPNLILKGIDKSRDEIHFDVASVRPPACSALRSMKFDIVYDLKEIPLETDKLYTLVFEGSSQRLTYKALKSLGGFDSYKTTHQSRSGTLVFTDDPPSGFALRNEGGTERVLPLGLDLSRYAGEAVALMGYQVVETASLYGNNFLAVTKSQDQNIFVPVSVTHLEPVDPAK